MDFHELNRIKELSERKYPLYTSELEELKRLSLKLLEDYKELKFRMEGLEK